MRSTIKPAGAFASLALLLAVVFPVAAAQESSAAQRPNVILIVADNQAARLLGAYGNSEIATPNIDALARSGVLFRHAFAASGVCSPTRAALLTGLMPSQTGIHVALPPQPELEGWSAIEEFRNLPQTLADAGYFTGLVGKYHLGRHEHPQLGFSWWVTFPSGHTTTFYDQEVIDNGRHYRVEKHLTDFWTDKAIEFIGQRPGTGEPFFLYLSYNGPYMLPPTVLFPPRNRHAERYRQNPPSMPHEPIHPYLEAWARGKSPTGEMVREGTTAWRAINAINNPVAMINTAAETTMVDDGVGRLMEALEEQGLREDTLVIYTSDQGSRFGHGGLWGNTSWSFPFTVHEVNMEVPLMFSQPGRVPEGAVRGEFINQVDVFPTLLEYVGLEELEIRNSGGRSFASMLRGAEPEWDSTAFFEFVTVRVVRSGRWKYMKRFDTGEPHTLFDLIDDPGEKRNLIDDPAHADMVAELDGRLTDFFAQYSAPEYDLWRGGSAKAILLDTHYGQNHIFRDRFPGWREPFVERPASVFRDR
ncbi:MAG: sulfatase-like hydrolase/transferase [Gammaproteobacteria bacterium]|nr:sulfatase-like hydrolase/transferase [Gammaproteobacteria bacterium]